MYSEGGSKRGRRYREEKGGGGDRGGMYKEKAEEMMELQWGKREEGGTEREGSRGGREGGYSKIYST